MEKQIYLRKSIRRYRGNDIGEAALSVLASWRGWADVYAQGADADCDIQLLGGDAKLGGMYFIKAPRYIAYWGRPTREGRINAGFILEQISLGLTELGVGTCYLGATHISGANPDERGLEPIIIMSCGNPAEPLTRTSTSEFKRKRLDKICDAELNEKMRVILESARLAPSAMNRQPWQFAIEGGRIICCVEHSGLDAFRRLSEIDMGIVMSHILLTARVQCGAAHIEHSQQDALKAPRGTGYVATIVTENL